MSYVDFSELSLNAQRIFVFIERKMVRENTTEVKASKAEIASNLIMSIPTVKIALRELKNTGYILPKNNNSPIVMVGEQYAFKTKKRGI